MKKAFVLLAFVDACFGHETGFFLGCYEHDRSAKYAGEFPNSSECTATCAGLHFKYASLRLDKACMCLNVLGKELSNSLSCKDCAPCQETFSGDIFVTNAQVPGPPKDFTVANVTSTSVHISYKEPESHVDIISYKVNAIVLHTYSGKRLSNLEYTYSNNTFRTSLVLLQPATKYNFSCQALSSSGLGAVTFQVVQTKLADPDIPPPPPDIIERLGRLMTIKINQVENNNGPVTGYRVVVLNVDSIQIYQPETLTDYDMARESGMSYYITAEIPVKESYEKFVIGDARFFGRYYNAPLDPKASYKVLVGVVSELNGDVRVLYSNINGRGLDNSENGRAIDNSNGASNVTVLQPQNDVLMITGDEEGASGIVIGLSVAIGFLAFVLVVTIVAFLILRQRIASRRMRLTDNQELMMQGPMIEIENSGYVPEEERGAVNYYDKLQERLRTIPKHMLRIDEEVVLGYGKFGAVYLGKNIAEEPHQRVAVYSISDKSLESPDKRSMLKDLDTLVRCGNHENVIALIGTSETSDVVNVALEYVEMDLKEFLLKSRDVRTFSCLSGHDALQIAIKVAKGMEHLQNKEIVHGNLCARNVLITADRQPKISGFGIAHYYDKNSVPDCTRWRAVEIFQGLVHTHKSDVWSFACLLWEICVLGGTPYGNVLSNGEIPDRVKRGVRLIQTKYISNDLYQIMLDCWQIDLDERPSFSSLMEMIDQLEESQLSFHLNYELLKYEPFYPELEITASTY